MYSRKASSSVTQELTAGFLSLHQTLEGTASQLESESRLLLTLAQLINCYAQERPALSALKVERAAVQRIREYVQENYAQNVSLAELARLTNLSAFHLTRVNALESWADPACLPDPGAGRAR